MKEFGPVVHAHCHRKDVIISLVDVKVRLIIHYYFYNCNIIVIVIGPGKEIFIHVQILIALLSDISMFYIKYLTMHKVHMQTGALWLCVCTGR